jgi:hypothetical protein
MVMPVNATAGASKWRVYSCGSDKGVGAALHGSATLRRVPLRGKRVSATAPICGTIRWILYSSIPARPCRLR